MKHQTMRLSAVLYLCFIWSSTYSLTITLPWSLPLYALEFDLTEQSRNKYTEPAISL